MARGGPARGLWRPVERSEARRGVLVGGPWGLGGPEVSRGPRGGVWRGLWRDGWADLGRVLAGGRRVPWWGVEGAWWGRGVGVP